jgi:DNA polymerase
MSEISRDEALALLDWLIEAGADEAALDAPVNRFAAAEAPKAAAPTPSLPPAAPASRPPASRKPSPETLSLSAAPSAARALAISSATLADLKNALTHFDGCDLKRFATNTVFADGTPAGRIMLIGEAPGQDEDAQGLPFVGRAGKLLDRMLAAIGLDRTKVYITNVLPWRPPQNRQPSPEEAAACLPFLHRHIELADPEILILLGAVSARHVLGTTEGIMRLRGRWDIYQSASGGRAIPVMPTLHPAFLLRQPAAKRLAWRDLLAVAEKIEQLGLA